MTTKKSSTATKVDKVWEKGKPIPGKNPETRRKDTYGNEIRRASHGGKGELGWEIDHKKPASKGGSDSIKNLQPLQHEENRAKSDKLKHKGK